MTSQPLISNELFTTALQQYFGNEKIQVLGFTSSAAIPVGDNYTSEVLRIMVTYTTGEKEDEKQIPLIVKCAPKASGVMESVVQELAMFETEVFVYTKIIPQIFETLGTKKYLTADCIYTNQDNTLIMFEDLKDLGFTMASRQDGLDLEHCLFILDKFAYCHAGSSVFSAQNLEKMSKYSKALFRDNEFNRNWLKIAYESLSDACSRWPGFEKYCEKLNRVKDNALEKTLAAIKRNENGFNVINHGDAWVNNFMFLYGPDGKLQDMRFVDFQLIIYTSPAMDLIYFWCSSPNLEVRYKHIEEIIDCYHAKLVKTLSELKYQPSNIPTKEELRKDCDSRAFYGLTTSATILPFVVSDKRDDSTVDNMLKYGGKDSFRYHAYNNERYRRHMEYLLPFFDNVGVFD